MTEYLILSLNRALPLIWEYNRQITFNLTFSRTYGSIPRSVLGRETNTGSSYDFVIDSTAKRLFRVFSTPSQPSVTGIMRISKPRLYRTAFTLISFTGNPQFRIDLHYANPDDTPGEYITSFTPTVSDVSGYRTVYVDWGVPPNAFSGYELDWDTKYAIVLVPTMTDANNRGTARALGILGTDPLPPRKCGYSTDGGMTWTFVTSGARLFDWASLQGGSLGNISVGIAWYYESEVSIPVAKSSEAFRSLFNGWVSRTPSPLPSGFNQQDFINGVLNPTTGAEIRFTDAYTHLMRFWTTADVAGFTQTDTAQFIWRYDINPVAIDMFYASEAYLQRIDFLANGSRIRLNDSYEQEFSGNSGQSVTFDPPILFWKLQVLSGSVRLSALVFE
ncbi:MAG: hypothetical protein ACO2O1_04200 [Candidatus Caldarchaeales archaeon]|jgi:hypothetical protein